MTNEIIVGPKGVSGREVTLGDGKKYVIAALTFGPAKRMESVFAEFRKKSVANEAVMDALIDALTASLKRNYDIERETVAEDLLDFGNRDTVQSALLNTTYPTPKDLKPGEAKGPTDLIGTASTQT